MWHLADSVNKLVRCISVTLRTDAHLSASPAPLTVGGEAYRSAAAQQTHRWLVSVTMSHRHRALSCLSIALVLLLRHGPGRVAELAVAAEYSSKTDLDYEFGDYRGKWCIDDHGFVYGIGEVYYPSPTACPCTCTVDGPVCVRPKCPRIHPRCTRIKYKACCPVCEAMARVCVYGGKTYRLLEEFRVRKIQTSTPRPSSHSSSCTVTVRYLSCMYIIYLY